MKMFLFFSAAIALSLSQFAAASLSTNDLITRGEYLAKAGDCTACHTPEGGKPFEGGYLFKMPMGTIVSSNITSSKEFGIGSWSAADFANALRKGQRPDGSQLYPAMPYTSYSNITDSDMLALYTYFQSVPSVDAAPTAKTELHFPFNLPGLMKVWNFIFVSGKPFTPDQNLSQEENRGKYLAEGLGHCSACHSPRNQMMAEDSSQYLAGAHVDGWLAPNITSDVVSGIGGWSKQELASYLKNGHAEGKGQAGGPMADAVEHSFSHLDDSDLVAIAAYIKKVPAIHNSADVQPSWSASRSNSVDWAHYEPGGSANNAEGYRNHSTTNGAMLYDSNCAACHGSSGQGSDDNTFPSLTHNSAVGAEDPSNLVMAIVDGIDRKGSDGRASMPAFSEKHQQIHSWLNQDQIASVANYVTEQFGHKNAHLSGEDVSRISSGNDESPFLIRHAALLAYIGVFIVALLLAGFVILLFKRRKN